MRRTLYGLAILVALGIGAGCDRQNASEQQNAADPSAPGDTPGAVVLYCSIDPAIASPIITQFMHDNSDVQVTVVSGVDAQYTHNLAARIATEKDAPAADVFWSDTVLPVARLARQGLLAAYDSPSASDVPAAYKDAQHRWTCSGLRARVIVVSERATLVSDLQRVQGLTDPTLKGKICMAEPEVGGMAEQVALLFQKMTDYPFRNLIIGVRDNDVRLLKSNAQVVQEVASGEMLAGLADSSDVDRLDPAAASHISAIYPNQADMGTEMVPSTVAMVGNRPQSQAAKKLVDYLLSADVEQKLIAAHYAAWSVRALPTNVKAMQVDYDEAAANMDRAIGTMRAVLSGHQPPD